MTLRALILAGYLAIVAGALVLEASARRRGTPATFRATWTTVLRYRPARLLVLAGWLWLGWHLFVRVDWR
jgi:Family of unknown function (DUF6186)